MCYVNKLVMLLCLKKKINVNVVIILFDVQFTEPLYLQCIECP